MLVAAAHGGMLTWLSGPAKGLVLLLLGVVAPVCFPRFRKPSWVHPDHRQDGPVRDDRR